MNNFRKTAAWNKRSEANDLANQRIHPRHFSNGDELKFRHTKETENCHLDDHHDHEKEATYKKNHEKNKPSKLKGKPSYMVSFTKGMPHDYGTGLVKNPIDFQYFVRAIDSGDPRDFRDTPLGPDAESGNTRSCSPPSDGWRSEKAKTGATDPHTGKKTSVGLRAWESQSAGLAFELEGPDAQAVSMPPHPKLGSEELTAEMTEVYCQALLRDVPFNALSNGVMGLDVGQGSISKAHLLKCLGTNKDDVGSYLHHTKQLGKLDWFNENIDLKLNPQEEARRCMRMNPNPATAFRGITQGDFVGPYLSQFLLVGNTGVNGNDAERRTADGLISYGAISADQRVRTAVPGQDYMTTWDEWMDVQEAAAVGGLEEYLPGGAADGRRFIHTPRDLATYVHYDALYEAYLNACLIMLGMGVPFDPGIPFQEDDNRDHQQGFAHFGGPHILSLVTEVATRALKAVRFQKYNVHRRCRPEVLAARIEKVADLKHMAPELEAMVNEISNKTDVLDKLSAKNGNYLLPMAFCEGSPMHPAYGAGHATVAGACVTILKAFFDHGALLGFVPEDEIKAYDRKILEKVKPGFKDGDIHSSNMAYVSVDNGKRLEAIAVLDKENKLAKLTVEGELNKLASNISIGRDWAGVHYFTDYYESLLMGEQMAIGILEEQKLMFGENFSMTIPLFSGKSLRI